MSRLGAASLRRLLVEELEQTGALRSSIVREAFLRVPRELFVPELAEREGLEAVYRNELVVTKADARGVPLSSSSEPQVMAAMLERLELEEGMRVLEVGAGSGYNAALLKSIVGRRGRVVSIDHDPELARKSRRALRVGGFAVRVVGGDGHLGHASAAPYDRLVVTASSATVPEAWRDQLFEGGLLELPLRLTAAGAQAIATFRRSGRRFESTSVVPGRFMPLRGEGIGDLHPPVLTVSHVLGNAREPVLTQLAGTSLLHLSEAARRRLVAFDEPRRRPLGFRSPAWSLALYLSLELPERRLVTRFADLATGVVGRGGRSLALLEGRWQGGERPTAQRLLSYGESEAEEYLSQALEEWRMRGRPGQNELRLEIDFRGGGSKISHAWEPAS